MRTLAMAITVSALLAVNRTIPAFNSDGKAAPPPTASGGAEARPVAPLAEQTQAAAKATQAGLRVEWNRQYGTPSVVRGADLGARGDFSGGKGLALRGGGAFEADAVAVMDNLARLYRIQDAEKEFAAKKAEADSLGFHHVRLQQRHEGLRVVGGDLIVHFNAQGLAYQVNGRYAPGVAVATAPQVKAETARTVALKDLASFNPGKAEQTGAPELVVYARGAAPQLAWELALSKADEPARWRYWVNAITGEVIHRHDEIMRVDPPTPDGAAAPITGNVLAGEGGDTVSVTGWHENTNGLYYLYNAADRWVIFNNADAAPIRARRRGRPTG